MRAIERWRDAKQTIAVTPELARATRTQLVLLSPVVFAFCACVSWLYNRDVVEAIVVGVSATLGALLATRVQTWIAGRG